MLKLYVFSSHFTGDRLANMTKSKTLCKSGFVKPCSGLLFHCLSRDGSSPSSLSHINQWDWHLQICDKANGEKIF